jgi:D-arabinose 1-dehydrogenase-like Zn-dependent alcohol dehydrogenase
VNAPELFLKNVSIVGTNVGNLEDFSSMCNFVAQHRLEPVIDRTFKLDSAPEALQYLQDGHKLGKVVITI